MLHHTRYKVCRLIGLKRLSLACEAAVLLRDWDLVARGVWKAYHLLLPLLRVSVMGRLLFQVRSVLSSSPLLVLLPSWSYLRAHDIRANDISEHGRPSALLRFVGFGHHSTPRCYFILSKSQQSRHLHAKPAVTAGDFRL